jgi:hypothetical protein
VVRNIAVLLVAAGWTISAQTPPIFLAIGRNVAVPLIVTDSAGHLVRDLTTADFELFDNDRPQTFHLDDTAEGFSVAVAVQTNHAVQAWLPHVRRIGNIVDGMLAGAHGNATVISFNDEVNVVSGVADLKAAGDKSRCLDAVESAVAELRRETAERRRVLLLIAQPGDYGSTAKLRDVLRNLELNNITVYSMTMPRVGKDLLGSIRISGAPQEGGGVVVSADLMKLVPEIYRSGKSGADAVSTITDYLGGTRIPFRDLRQLEAGLASIGEELHTGYVLSYTPDRADAGYHRIRVETPGRVFSVRARPGYYVASE